MKVWLHLYFSISYLPSLSESQVSSADVSFSPDPRRQMLFLGKTFIFLSPSQVIVIYNMWECQQFLTSQLLWCQLAHLSFFGQLPSIKNTLWFLLWIETRQCWASHVIWWHMGGFGICFLVLSALLVHWHHSGHAWNAGVWCKPSHPIQGFSNGGTRKW